MWLKITENYSPNFNTPKRLKKNIKYIIIHYTGMRGELSALNRLTDHKSKVSAHYFIKKNGKIRQSSNTSKMIYKIDDLISYISKYFTLKIGDIVFTGTPSGVGNVEKNDLLEGFIENKKIFKLEVK